MNDIIKEDQHKESFWRRLKHARVPLLAAAGVLLTAFVAIPLMCKVLDAGDEIVEVSGVMAAQPVATPLPTPAIAEPTPPPEPEYRALQLGDSDPAVVNIQERLMALQYIDGDEPSETFGTALESALKRFQRVHHMTETGVADELTQEILFSDGAAPYRLEKGDNGEDVESLQERLHELGYEVEKLNGYFGIATTNALVSFQQKNKLEASGIMDQDTADVLYSNNAKPKVDPTPTPTPRPSKTPRPATTKAPTFTFDGSIGTTKTAPPSNTGGGGSVATATGDVSGFIATAKAQQGKPYVWGDEGPNSFDCSGLVYYSLINNGVKVGRLSARSYAVIDSWPTITSTSSLQPGDLLFFRSDSSSTISHTGIWLGGGQYVHASFSAERVVVSSWSDWAARNFSHGKRVF